MDAEAVAVGGESCALLLVVGPAVATVVAAAAPVATVDTAVAVDTAADIAVAAAAAAEDTAVAAAVEGIAAAVGTVADAAKKPSLATARGLASHAVHPAEVRELGRLCLEPLSDVQPEKAEKETRTWIPQDEPASSPDFGEALAGVQRTYRP